MIGPLVVVVVVAAGMGVVVRESSSRISTKVIDECGSLLTSVSEETDEVRRMTVG